LTWSIDGNDQRTVKRSDTWNSTAGRFDYPQTPSRIMLSLWPAGLPSNAKGTIDWAGGEISWNSPYMQNGYYYAMVSQVTVKCYDPPSGAQKSGSKSYIYTGEAGTNDTVQITDKTQILKSFYATGENDSYDPNASKSSASGSTKTGTAAAESTSAEIETVPGMSGAGNQAAENGNAASSASGSQATGGADAGGSASGSANSPSNTGGFSQGGGGGGQSGAAEMKSKALGGSIFAVWVGVLGLLIL
jgi:cobalamin biosynthesis Mg chelatase CobN